MNLKDWSLGKKIGMGIAGAFFIAGIMGSCSNLSGSTGHSTINVERTYERSASGAYHQSINEIIDKSFVVKESPTKENCESLDMACLRFVQLDENKQVKNGLQYYTELASLREDYTRMGTTLQETYPLCEKFNEK